MAIRTISDAGGNFNATGTWVEGVVPVAGDDVVATATSGNLTVNVASGGVGLLSFIMTNYTGILTMDNTLTISGTMTLVSGMGTIAGTSAIICNTTATLTSGGKVIPQLSLAGSSQTYTLADNFQVGDFININSITLVTLNGNTLSVSGNVIVSRLLTGTTNLVYNTSTTQSIDVQSSCSLPTQTFNAVGTITIVAYGLSGGILTYTAGVVDWANSTLTISASATLNLGTMPTALNNLTTSGVSPTITLLSDLYVRGTLTLSSSGTPIWTGNTLYIGGNLIHQTNSIQTGTTTFVMNGTGTWVSTSINCIIRNNFTINTTGKITFGALVVYNTGTFTYLSGKVVAPKNSIFLISIGVGTTLINCHKINFETVQITQSTTITMNEFFSGSPNKPVKVISSATANYNITFQNGYEKIAKYVKVSNLTLTNTAASRGSLLILNNKGKYFRGSNNIGNIRYTNTAPNGIAKGDPSVPNQMTAPIGGYLSDPVFN